MHKYILIFTFAGLLTFSMTSAHGLVTKQTQTVKPYTIEFEYNSLSNIKAGDVAIYGVYLLESESLQPVHFDSVYLKISDSKGAPVLFSTLKESFDMPGSAHFGGILKDAGKYTAEAQFVKDDKQIGPLTYEFNVDSELNVLVHKKLPRYEIYIPGLIGLITLISAIILHLKHRKHKNHPPV